MQVPSLVTSVKHYLKFRNWFIISDSSNAPLVHHFRRCTLLSSYKDKDKDLFISKRLVSLSGMCCLGARAGHS